MARSTLQVTISPGVTADRPAALAMIFCASVCPWFEMLVVIPAGREACELAMSDSQIGTLELGIGQQFRRSSLEIQRAVLDDIGAPCDLQ